MKVGDKVIAKADFIDCKRKTLKGIIIGFDWAGWPIVRFNRSYMYGSYEIGRDWSMHIMDLQKIVINQ